MEKKEAKLIRTLVSIVLFIVGLAMIIKGQHNIGITGLLIMLVGLCILLFVMWLYNRQYQ